MKGDVTLKILDTIKDVAIETTDLFEVLASTRYGTSISTFNFELSKRKRERSKRTITRAIQEKELQNYYNLLYKLKRDGLIEKGKNLKSILTITNKGRERLKKLDMQKRKASYGREEGNRIVIVAFDIPEDKRKARDWLREALRNIGFQMIQKSVWMGKLKIHKSFLKDVREWGISGNVEIFEISKMGSLNPISS